MKDRWSLRAFGMVLAATLALGGALSARAATSASGNERTQLLWYTLGLREMEKGKDHTVRLTKAQARQILPVLDQLAALNLFTLKMPERRKRTGSPDASGSQGTNASRVQLQQRRQEAAKQIAGALGRIEKVLRPNQNSVIDNLDFDPAEYGILNFQGSRSDMTQEQIAAMRKQQAAGLKKQAALNNEVLTLLRKKAGK